MVAGEPGYYGPKPAVWGTMARISGYWGYYAETGGWGYCGLVSVTWGTNLNYHARQPISHTHPPSFRPATMDLEDDLIAVPRGRGRPRGDEFTEEEDSDKVCCCLISDRLTSILIIGNRSRFDSVSALQIIHQENEEELEEQ